jgi:hypothetical protein
VFCTLKNIVIYVVRGGGGGEGGCLCFEPCCMLLCLLNDGRGEIAIEPRTVNYRAPTSRNGGGGGEGRLLSNPRLQFRRL